MGLKIKEAASAAGVSVRTLHHYDQIGLLCPQKTHENGYRLYSDSDIERLQHIMFFKELDFSLSEISKILNKPEFDRLESLRQQQNLLIRKKQRLERIITALENTIISTEDGKDMSNSERFDAFSMDEINEHKKRYAAEASEKYGRSGSWKESAEKTSKYSEQDWRRIMVNGNNILSRLAELTGHDPSEAAVQECVRDWQKHITESFYNCTDEILSGLGEMYVNDKSVYKKHR